MGNPLYKDFGNKNPFEQIIRDAQELKRTFNGDPREEVQRLLNSGQMSQADFNRYSKIAQQVILFMGN